MVECSCEAGNSVAFWRLALQLIGLILLQSEPAGQQITDVVRVVLIFVHVVCAGQQKSAGKPLPHWLSEASPPQVEALVMRSVGHDG